MSLVIISFFLLYLILLTMRQGTFSYVTGPWHLQSTTSALPDISTPAQNKAWIIAFF